MNKRFIIAFIGVFLLLSVYYVGYIVKADGENWLTGWDYRKSHTINYTTGAGINYQKKITVHYGGGSDSGEDVYLNSKCKTDFGDIRFTDNDGNTELDYWMEEKTDSDNAVFWVEVADDLNSSNATIYVYYGNASATTTSNIKTASMFGQGDDFNDNTRDTALWDTVIVGTGSPTEVNQRLEMAVPSSTDMAGYVSVNTKTLNTVAIKVRAYNPFSQTVSLVICLTKVTASNYYNEQNWYRIMFYHNGGNSYYVQKKVDGSVTTLYSGALINNENNMEIRIEDGTIRFFEGTTERASETWSLPSRNCYIYLISRGFGANVGTTWEDTFWVRKYVSPEPSHGAWGSEEEESGDEFPFYSDISDNGITQVGESLQCYITIEDDLNIDGYIFSHNSSGTYTNYTFSIEDVTVYIEVTNNLILNFTKNIKVGYMWFMYDNSSQYNQTSIFYVTTTPLYINFYLNNSTMGNFYVDLVNVANETQNDYNYNQSINLIGVPFNSNYTFNNFTWNNNNSIINDYNYYTSGNNTLWCNFDSVSIGGYTEEDLNSYFVIGSIIVGIIAFSVIIIWKEKK